MSQALRCSRCHFISSSQKPPTAREPRHDFKGFSLRQRRLVPPKARAKPRLALKQLSGARRKAPPLSTPDTFGLSSGPLRRSVDTNTTWRPSGCVRPYGGSGLLLSSGGDRAWEENQTADLGHRGQERFRSITRAYYRNSVGGLLLFDITNRRSFQNVHDWLEEARSHVQPHSIVFLLVGHKCDLEAQRQVSRQEAEKLAGAYGMRYVETSARDAINVEHAFTELTREIFALVRSGDITIQEGWEGVKSGFVPNVVHSSEEVTKSDRRCLC
ncbi:hypothetical protein WMY93_014121 [Mugilogobius chulae]|uniref:Ras-related protein Rab-39B n=1 Tax=Mugilogobius chulae TaxID=88201 RepID=A0AAW0NU29_9GOBI